MELADIKDPETMLGNAEAIEGKRVEDYVLSCILAQFQSKIDEISKETAAGYSRVKTWAWNYSVTPEYNARAVQRFCEVLKKNGWDVSTELKADYGPRARHYAIIVNFPAKNPEQVIP